jgi:glucokinase
MGIRQERGFGSAMGESLVIGIDLGGTKVATAAADLEGSLLSKVIKPTCPERGVDAVIDTVVDSVKEAAASAGASKADIKSIGIGSPGPIDPEAGTVIFAPNLMWHNVPIVHILEGILDLPVYLENDANVAGLGEYRFGAGRDSKNMIYITVSTGVGGGLILDGKIHAGSFGMAGEVGHMTIVNDGPLCGCGNQGCLEALAAGPAIARKARACVLHGEETIMADMVSGRIEEITSKTVGEAALAGDILAKEIVDKTGEYLGIGVANLINVINPDAVVIGGGVSNMGELLLVPLRRAAGRRAIKAAFEKVRIVKAELGSDAGVVGAVCLALGGV